MAHRCDHCQATCLGYPAREPEPSPDIARLLATNEPASAIQEEEFRKIRAEDAKRLAELETIIEELQVERNALAWKVEHHRLVLNPVRRLPADILREIFLFACARTKYPFHFYLIPPTFLAAVCRSWNHIVVTSPQLWQTYKFGLPERRLSAASDEKACLMSGLSVSRSAMCPLWLDLRLDDSLSYFHPSYPFILAISARIHGLRISTDDLRFFAIPEFRHFASGLTALVHMHLWTSTNRDTTLTGLALPRTLKHLTIPPHAAFSNPEVDFNWSHLESLVLRVTSPGASIQAVLNILSKVRNLRRLTFSNEWHPKDILQDVTPGGVVTIRHLTDLVLESSTLSLYDVWTNISTPSLERLVIGGVSSEILPRVKEMIQKSDGTLRHLTLQSLGDDHNPVHTIYVADSLIRQCGLLRELSLLVIHACTEFIVRLLPPLESLPQLRVLTLDISYAHDFPVISWITLADSILAYLESCRGLAGAPDLDTGAASRVDLESFTLHAPPEEVFDFTEAQHLRIRALRASGLQLYICRYAENDPRPY